MRCLCLRCLLYDILDDGDIMIAKEYVEYFEKYLEDVKFVEMVDTFTFPDGEEFPIVELIIEATKGESNG